MKHGPYIMRKWCPQCLWKQ